MPVAGNIQVNTSAEKSERIDVNPNVSPAYLINQDQPQLFPADGKIGSDFSASGRGPQATPSKLKPGEAPNYIPNLDRPASAAVLDGTDAAGGAAGTPEDVEQNAIAAAGHIMDRADKLSANLESGNWKRVDKETGYEYIDPRFYVEYKKLTNLLNALQAVGMAIDALQALKRFIINQLSPRREDAGADESSASETLAVARESGMLRAQGQLLELTEVVTTHNQALMQERINRAREEAHAEWYDYASEVVTSGGSDAASRHKEERAAREVHKISKKYEAFSKKVQAQYEQVLGRADIYADGVTDAGDVYRSMTWDNLTVDIGAGKVDIDRNKFLAGQMLLSSHDNFRRLFLMLQKARQDLKNIVIESETGMNLSDSTRRVLGGVLESLEKFESMVFSAMAQQLQDSIGAQNRRVDAFNDWVTKIALYFSSMTYGSIPLIGGVTRNIGDWMALEIVNACVDFATNPSQLDMSQVYRYLADITGMSAERIRAEMNSGDGYGKELAALERREWSIIEKLSAESVVYVADDGFKGVHEKRVNSLREQLVKVQNAERLIYIVVEALARVRKLTAKIATELGEAGIGDDVKGAQKAGFESRLLAFDLKFSGIKNMVEADNKERQWQKQLAKAGWVALGSVFMAGVAVVLLAVGAVTSPFTGGLGFVAAVGFVAAMGQLGAALSSITYNSLNQVDDRVYDETDFYDDMMEKNEDNIDKMYNSAVDTLDGGSHIKAEDSADPLSGGDQWAKDTRQFMAVRDQLTRIYLYEQIVLMYEQAKQNIRSLATANFTGVFAGDAFDQVREASRDRFGQKINAYGLKEEMVEDIISRHNMAADQRTELNWAIVNAAISAVKIVCSAAGSSCDPGGNAAANWGWAGFGADLAGMALQASKNILDGTSGYGELEEFKGIQDQLTGLINNTTDRHNRRILQEALEGMKKPEDMLESAGAGAVVADSSRYYQSVRSVQLLFNRITLALRVQEGIARVKARITGGPQVEGAADFFEEQKAATLKQLELLNERIQVYVERSNAMNDAWRQLAVTAVLIAVKVFQKCSDEFGWMNSLKSSANKGWSDKAEIKITGDHWARTQVPGVALGQPLSWSGTLGVADLINLSLDLAFNANTLSLITRLVYDKIHRDEKRAPKVASAEPRSNSTMDRLEADSFNNRLRLAKSEIRSKELDIDDQHFEELMTFTTNAIDDGLRSIFDDSWENDLVKLNQLGESVTQNLIAVPETVRQDLSRALRPLDKIDWAKPDDVKQKMKEVTEVIRNATNLEGRPLKKEERNALVYEAAFEMATRLEGSSQLQQVVAALKGLVAAQIALPADDGRIEASVALAALGRLSAVDADALINEVWGRVAAGGLTAESAQELCAVVTNDRMEQVVVARSNAEIALLNKPVKEELLSVNWQTDSRELIEAKLSRVVQKLSMTDGSDKAEGERRAIAASAEWVANIVAGDPLILRRAIEMLELIKTNNPNNKPLQDYIAIVLQKVQSAQQILRAGTAAPTTGPAIQERSKNSKQIAQIQRTAQEIGEVVRAGGDPSEKFARLKVDVLALLISQDTAKMGIRDLPALIKRINLCSDLKDLADLINEVFLNNGEFEKSLAVSDKKCLRDVAGYDGVLYTAAKKLADRKELDKIRKNQSDLSLLLKKRREQPAERQVSVQIFDLPKTEPTPGCAVTAIDPDGRRGGQGQGRDQDQQDKRQGQSLFADNRNDLQGEWWEKAANLTAGLNNRSGVVS